MSIYCTVEDCGETVRARSWCSKHYQRWQKHGDPLWADLRRTHGHTVNGKMSETYMCWWAIKQRCLNANHHAFPYYGGRGITVCDEWRDNFAAFLAHVGLRPSPDYSIDRIDNDGNYEPGNVRWATATEQSNNRRPYVNNNARKTHCPQGHAYDNDNTRWYQGRRYCRKCKRDREELRREQERLGLKQPSRCPRCHRELRAPGRPYCLSCHVAQNRERVA